MPAFGVPTAVKIYRHRSIQVRAYAGAFGLRVELLSIRGDGFVAADLSFFEAGAGGRTPVFFREGRGE